MLVVLFHYYNHSKSLQPQDRQVLTASTTEKISSEVSEYLCSNRTAFSCRDDERNSSH